MQKKLAIITSHPIQYNAPLFKEIAQRNNILVKVFYTWGQSKEKIFDPGFGKEREWDLPLLEGYDFEFVNNISKSPGSHYFKGIDNPELIRMIVEYDPKAILVFGWSFKSHLKVIKHFKGKVKLLFRGDSNLLDERKGLSIRKVIRKILLKWVYSLVDTALYVGSANRNYYLKYGLKNEQLIYAPHAIDNCRFANASQNTIRQQFGIPDDDIVFLFAGKFEKKKNPILLLEAFIRANINNAHLLLVGNGELEKLLKSRVQSLDSEIIRHIHFMDFQNQSKMPEIYNACDVFVLPSQGPGETWGLSVNEAMACSRAVLVSDKCGCYLDLVQDGVNGFVFNSNDIKGLVEKMKGIILKNLEEMGMASQQIIQSWSYTNVCLAIEKECNNVYLNFGTAS
ncbi:MAG TPA: glycosyltransferase family 4 protein [Chitinophagaceae bacterium]|nr:glycosyltransferase family 4 protein [Chitinophagaceae bacterium]